MGEAIHNCLVLLSHSSFFSGGWRVHSLRLLRVSSNFASAFFLFGSVSFCSWTALEVSMRFVQPGVATIIPARLVCRLAAPVTRRPSFSSEVSYPTADEFPILW